MNRLLNQQLIEVLRGTGFTEHLRCEGALRIGAGTLCRAAPGEIIATTVVCDLQGGNVETLESLIQNIADEYGLEASIQQRPGSYAVRFTCPPLTGASTDTLPANKSMLARLLRR